MYNLNIFDKIIFWKIVYRTALFWSPSNSKNLCFKRKHAPPENSRLEAQHHPKIDKGKKNHLNHLPPCLLGVQPLIFPKAYVHTYIYIYEGCSKFFHVENVILFLVAMAILPFPQNMLLNIGTGHYIHVCMYVCMYVCIQYTWTFAKTLAKKNTFAIAEKKL